MCAGDWEAAAGKVTVQQAIIIPEPLLIEVGEQDEWKGIVLTQRRGKGCWEPTCWERLRNQQGMLKHWQILLRSCHWFLHLFISFLWQFDGCVCAHSGTRPLPLCRSCWAPFVEDGKMRWQHYLQWLQCLCAFIHPLNAWVALHHKGCIEQCAASITQGLKLLLVSCHRGP